MNNVFSRVTRTCVKMLRKHPDSAELVADILEQVDDQPSPMDQDRPTVKRLIGSVFGHRHGRILRKPVAHRKTRRAPARKTTPVAKHAMVKPPMQRIQRAKSTLRPSQITWEMALISGVENLHERHNGKSIFRITKSNFESVCRVLSEGHFSGGELIRLAGVRDYLTHVTMRFLASKGLVNKAHNRYSAKQMDGWLQQAMNAWESMKTPEAAVSEHTV